MLGTGTRGHTGTTSGAATTSAEALTLSASLFHADVDTWLPAGFGVERSASAREADWAAARSFGAGGERLGLGHPDLANPDARRAAASKRAGENVLRKAMKRKSGNDEEEHQPVHAAAASDSDEGESRTRAVGKKKRRKQDAFARGAAQNKVHPLLNLQNPIPGYDAPAAVPTTKVKSPPPQTLALGDDVNPAAALAASLAKSSNAPAAMRVSAPQRPSDAAGAEPPGPALSKAEKKREKKKRQKAKKAAAATAT